MRLLAALIVSVFCVQVAIANPVRIKDLVEFDGVRGKDLVGYGLVVGLDGTGDGLRNAPFTEDIMTNILERLGVNVTGEQFRPKNVAAVFVPISEKNIAPRIPNMFQYFIYEYWRIIGAIFFSNIQ